MKIQNLSISLIKPYEKNAKLHDEVQIQNVAESIRQFGWQQPIVVDKNYIIIIGHCRFMAAQRLGYTEVPVVVADSLSEDQVTKLRIVDNKSNESDWDLELLKDDIGDLDFAGFDFDFGFKEPPADVKDDDFDIDAAKPLIPNAQEGDIYLLGRHRLMCGSSTDDVAVSRLMDGKLADLLFTDPPYNVNIENSDGLQIENDNLTNDAFVQLLDGAFRLASANMKPGDIVLDLFGGSGSTLMVCEELGRTCYMMELDPTYVDVIIARWESLTGKKATKYEKQ